MNEIAFIFPGQGAQYAGMGRDFYEKNIKSRQIYDEASDLLGLDFKKLCFEENEQLHMTEYTQAALLVTELAILAAVQAFKVSPKAAAGLSLGEYSALVAAGKLSFEDAVKVVRQRGILMQEAVPKGGAMAAVLGLDNQSAAAICINTAGIVELANYNCPGQIVISGEETAVNKASEAMKKAGAKRVMPLKVSGPFHSSMLFDAGEKLFEVLKNVSFIPSEIPYVSNVTAAYVEDIREIPLLLKKQVYSGVKWEQSVRTMLSRGIEQFIEIGPGKTLSGFIKRIDRTVRTITIEKYEDLEKLVSK